MKRNIASIHRRVVRAIPQSGIYLHFDILDMRRDISMVPFHLCYIKKTLEKERTFREEILICVLIGARVF